MQPHEQASAGKFVSPHPPCTHLPTCLEEDDQGQRRTRDRGERKARQDSHMLKTNRRVQRRPGIANLPNKNRPRAVKEKKEELFVMW